MNWDNIVGRITIIYFNFFIIYLAYSISKFMVKQCAKSHNSFMDINNKLMVKYSLKFRTLVYAFWTISLFVTLFFINILYNNNELPHIGFIILSPPTLFGVYEFFKEDDKWVNNWNKEHNPNLKNN